VHFLRASACSTPREGADIHSRHRLDVGRQSVAKGRECAQDSQVLDLSGEDRWRNVYAGGAIDPSRAIQSAAQRRRLRASPSSMGGGSMATLLRGAQASASRAGSRFKTPPRVDRTLDLADAYVVPPFAEAHNHNLGTGAEDRDKAAIQEYLVDGVFYVMIQGNLPLTDEAKRRLSINGHSSVDALFAHPPHPQRDHSCGRERCVLEWRLRSVGIDVPGHRRGDRVSWATVVSVDRSRLADSCVLGHCASPEGPSHLAVHAELRVRLHDVRQLDCAVVPRRCAIVPEAPARRDARRRCVNDGFADLSRVPGASLGNRPSQATGHC
jgi:hypothetical protein